MPDRALGEIQAADMLGFSCADRFRQAVKEGVVPPPVRYMRPDRSARGRHKEPVWSERSLQDWLDQRDQEANNPKSVRHAFANCR